MRAGEDCHRLAAVGTPVWVGTRYVADERVRVVHQRQRRHHQSRRGMCDKVREPRLGEAGCRVLV